MIRKSILHFVSIAPILLPAFAQIPAGPLTCATNVGTPAFVRSAGLAERVSDIVITCIGGSPAVPPFPTFNLVVSFGTNVTSRIVSVASGGSEALLLIDDPTAPVPGVNLIQGTANANQVSFLNVPMNPP